MLFIDANIYLDFFRSNKEELKKLLPTLESLKIEIFITEQVVNEVSRNKVKIASDSLKEYLNKCNLQSVRLPEHLDNDDKKIKKWNEAEAKLRAEMRSLDAELNNIINNLLITVTEGKDSVSVAFNNIFKKAVTPIAAEFEQAKLRKELGEDSALKIIQ